MPKVYKTKVWQLEIPAGWSAEGDREQVLVTLFKPDGVGMLRVLTSDGKSSVSEDKRESFRGKLHGATSSTTHAGSLFRRWSLLCGKHQLLVTYSCAAKNADTERSEVDDILQSISQAGTEPA